MNSILGLHDKRKSISVKTSYQSAINLPFLLRLTVGNKLFLSEGP